jgi:DNA invertase Pin-like site-specific DNA recombinase
MKDIKAVAYGRVSTLLNQDVEHQLHGIRELSKNRGFTLTEVYVDRGISGTKDKRPSLDRLIKDARMGKFSILIVHSIDRLGRSTKHLLNLLDELRHYGVSLISIRENIDFSTPMGQLALTMLGAVGQLEAQLISERIKTSLAVKKKLASDAGSDWRCGRPSLSGSLKDQVLKLHQEGTSIRNIANQLEGISKSSVAKIIKESKGVHKP